MSVWIFQSNPRLFRLDDYLSDYFHNRCEVEWAIRQEEFLDVVAINEDVFMWRAKGVNSIPGVIAHGYITTRPRLITWPDPEYWIIHDNHPVRYRVSIRLDDLRLTGKNGMIRKDEIATHPILSNMYIMRFFQRTNYRLSPREARALSQWWEERRIQFPQV